MKKQFPLLIAVLCVSLFSLMTGCKRYNGNVWDDNTTTSHYKQPSRSLWGNDELSQEENVFFASDDEFIALKDEDLQAQFADGAAPLAKTSPGEKGSNLPGIERFHSPTGSELSIFKMVHFNTDDHIVRGKEDLAVIEKISSYLINNPSVYLFVTGNCDERGPQAYNLSLGSRRANYVRTLLVQKGIDPERIHTISYGKEKPIDLGHTQESWKKNRRAEFLIYKKS